MGCVGCSGNLLWVVWGVVGTCYGLLCVGGGYLLWVIVSGVVVIVMGYCVASGGNL